jgi:heme A synthase
MQRSRSVPTYLTTEQLTHDLALRDLTDAGAGPHAIQLLVGLAADALSAAWACPTRPSPGPRIVAIADNYDNLGFTAGAASRDARYTRYTRYTAAKSTSRTKANGWRCGNAASPIQASWVGRA